jgi:iduronate 2-sulfatase
MIPRILIALLLPLPLSQSLSAADRPHVLLICVDDLKPALGCYGDPLAKTPHIDRLAARGMRFNLAYCNQAVCSPSRNNLLLGSRSTSLGIYSLNDNFRLAQPNAVTLPRYFIKHGWQAGAAGKILHTGHGNHDDPASWSDAAYHDKVVEYHLPSSSANGQLTREEAYFTNQKLGQIQNLPKGAAWEKADVPDDTYADGRIAAEGIRRLREANEKKDTPFFLALGFVKPHLPFTAPTRYWDKHDPQSFSLAKNQQHPERAPAYAGKAGGEILNYEPLTKENLTDESTQRNLIHGYYAATSFVDAQIGKVLEELDRLKLTDNTIIVLWGDHGWHLGDHGYWTKHTNYEQANRIPLLIIAPGVTKPGSATRQLAETVDVYPTLAELAGLPAPSGPQPIDGLSLVPVLRDPTKTIRDHATHCYPRAEKIGRAIRTERYRMIEWKTPGAAPETAGIELYDYQTDPEETRNIAEEQPEIVADLRAKLARQPEALKPGSWKKQAPQ